MDTYMIEIFIYECSTPVIGLTIKANDYSTALGAGESLITPYLESLHGRLGVNAELIEEGE